MSNLTVYNRKVPAKSRNGRIYLNQNSVLISSSSSSSSSSSGGLTETEVIDLVNTDTSILAYNSNRLNGQTASYYATATHSHSQLHTHTNATELDSITSTKITNWDNTYSLLNDNLITIDKTNDRLYVNSTNGNEISPMTIRQTIDYDAGLTIWNNTTTTGNSAKIYFKNTSGNNGTTYSSFIGGERTSTSQDVIIGVSSSVSSSPTKKFRFGGDGNLHVTGDIILFSTSV